MAAAYSDREILLINPYPAAGPADLAGNVAANRVLRLMQNHGAPAPTDFLARQIQHALASGLGRPVRLERRPRQRMFEAHRFVAHSTPDGHTLLLSGDAPILVEPQRAGAGTFDPAGSLTPVALIARMPVVMIMAPQSGLRRIEDFMAGAHRRPGRLHYGSSGEFSASHLAGAWFEQISGVHMTHVAYNGGAAAVNAVLSSQVESAFVVLPAALPYLRNGRVAALGIAAAERHPALPELPTFPELGLPGIEAAAWYGLFVPAGTPREVVKRIESEIASGLYTERSRGQWLNQGFQPTHIGSEDFAQMLRLERRKRAGLFDETGMREGLRPVSSSRSPPVASLR
jgi:tripartite-type tricarboxylate transporter receptor subunit TctC